MTPQERDNIMTQNKIFSIRPATKEHLMLDGLTLLNYRLGNLQTREWFGVALHLDTNTLLVTFFIDRFIQKTFPLERKIVTWQFLLVAILAFWRSSTPVETSRLGTALSKNTKRKIVQNKFTPTIIKATRQSVVPPITAAQVLLTTTSLGLLLIQSYS